MDVHKLDLFILRYQLLYPPEYKQLLMTKAFLFLICLATSLLSLAQSPGISWQKSLGGSAADEAKSVQPTPDGGYIVGGTTFSTDGDVTGNHGGSDCWVVKLNAVGNIEWQQCYGGTLNETFGSIRITADGGYIMSATTNSNDGDVSGNHGSNDAWLVKINNAGTMEWQKCFGSSSGDLLEFAEETLDGGFICKGISGDVDDGDLAGQSPVSIGGGWIFKLNNARNIQWQKTWFSACTFCGGSLINFIRQTNDSGYVYGGYTPGGLSSSTFITKLNSAGMYVGGQSFYSQGQVPISSAAPTNDNGCVTLFTDEYGRRWFRKYNSAMVAEWSRQMDTLAGGWENTINRTTDGGFLLTGYCNEFNSFIGRQGTFDYYAAKLSGTGVLQWQRALGSAGEDYGYWGESAADSSYILAGKGASSSGNITGNHGGTDFWVVRLPYSSPNFAIIASAGANGSISPNGGILYPLGMTQKFTITPNRGYHITDVLVDGASNAAAIATGTYTFDSINTSHTISATFGINTYTITATSGGNGLITPLGSSTVNYGTSKTYTITPATGYEILDVLIDSIPVNPGASYTFSNITASHTIRALFARGDSVLTYVCTAGDSATITSDITGSRYRWQLNSGNGNGYVNLNDGQGLYFGGTSTQTLTIKNYTPDAFGYKYRCVVNEQSSLVNVLRFQNTWQGTFGSNWEIPQNWSCGRIPDSTTDVVIPAGSTLVISTNITVRSLTTGPGANITLAAGGNLTILH